MSASHTLPGNPPPAASVVEVGRVANRLLRGFVWVVGGLATTIAILIAVVAPESRPVAALMVLFFLALPVTAEIAWRYQQSKRLGYATEPSGNLWIRERDEWTGPIHLPSVRKIGGLYVTFRSIPHTRHIYLGGTRKGNSDTVDLTFMNREDAEHVFWFLKRWLTHPARTLHGAAKRWFHSDGTEVTFPW